MRKYERKIRYAILEGILMLPEDINAEVHNRMSNKSIIFKCNDCDGPVNHTRASTCGTRRAYFSHSASDESSEQCGSIVREQNRVKYGHGGESEEHLQTKLQFGGVKTVQQVCMKCNKTPTWILHIDPKWTFSTEVRLPMENGSYIVADGVFKDQDGKKMVVIEIKHKNATKGRKRTWATSQSFEYGEFECGIKSCMTVIDSKHKPKLCDECAHQKEQQEHKKEQQETMRQITEDEHRKRDKRRREEEEQERHMEREKRARQDKAKEQKIKWETNQQNKKTEEERQLRKVYDEQREKDMLELKVIEKKRREEEDETRVKHALEQKERTRKLKIDEGKKQDNITFGHFYNDIRTRHGEASADFMVGLAESTHVSTKE